jgi:hypothetical protein
VLGAAVVPVFVDRIGIDDDEAFPVGDPVKTAIGKPGRSFARSAPAVQVKKDGQRTVHFFFRREMKPIGPFAILPGEALGDEVGILGLGQEGHE